MATRQLSGSESAQRTLVHLFLGLVAIQFFLAGLGVFRNNPKPDEKIVESSTFDPHRILGDVLILLGLIILILAVVTRRQLQVCGLLFGLLVVQSLLAGFGEDTPVVGALHVLNALVIVAVGAILLIRLRPDTVPGQAEPRA